MNVKTSILPETTPTIDWSRIQSVFLDMDGTLLDLHFDNHFWREHVPQRYAQRHGLDLEKARSILFPRFQAVEGTMNWYCVDYWSRELDLDIPLLKEEINHLIAVHPYVIEFLHAMRRADKRVVLVTNAHQKSLQLKMERTQLSPHFDTLICTHDFGIPKENPEFWPRLQEKESFDPEQTLLVDDSLPVLISAREYGIKNLLAIRNPDSKSPPREIVDFPFINSFQELLPE